MNTPNSSTSSFKSTAPSRVRDKLVVGLWFVLALGVIDAGTGWVFAYPDSIGAVPNRLERYFDYGRSVESRVLRSIGPDGDSPSSIAQAGWWEYVTRQEHGFQPAPPGSPRLSVFGMSFATDLAGILENLKPRSFHLNIYDGPSAPLNHAYALYQRSRGQTDDDIVILGVLDSSLPALLTMTGATWMTDSPPAYTYPRYLLENGELRKIEPVAPSLHELHRTLTDDPDARTRMLGQLGDYDAFYDPFVYERNGLDHSTVARLVRRAWASRQYHHARARYHNAEGFNRDAEFIPTAEAILTEFAASVRHDGKLPIVVLFGTQGYGDQLYQALSPVLEKQAIPYLSTHTIAPATERHNFIHDGHFTTEVNRKLAEALFEIIKREYTPSNQKDAKL